MRSSLGVLLAIPIFGLLLILQTSIVSRWQLLHGTADLVLLAIVAWSLQKRVVTAFQWSIIGGLMVNIVSALPIGIPTLGYFLTTGVALALRRRVWQVPILAMFFITFLGTLISQLVSLVALGLIGNPIPILETLNLIILPSLLLNLLFAIPAYAMFGELAGWVYPEALDV